MRRIASLVVCLALLGGACGEARPAAAGAAFDTAETSPSEGGRLDGLTLTLTLERTTFEPGRTIAAEVRVQNRSDSTIVDPSCLIGAERTGVIPRDEPDAQLWNAIVVDCGGELRMPPGYAETFDVHYLRATDAEGEPLPEGEYLAALELSGFSERLAVPIVLAD